MPATSGPANLRKDLGILLAPHPLFLIVDRPWSPTAQRNNRGSGGGGVWVVYRVGESDNDSEHVNETVMMDAI